MKKIMILCLVIFALLTSTGCSKAKTDKQLVKEYCRRYYKGYKVIFIDYDEERILHRKSSKKILVEIVKSKSKGNWGITMDAHYIRYNKKVKKGKTVTSYLIYNPKTNYIDDVIAVVDNGKIR